DAVDLTVVWNRTSRPCEQRRVHVGLVNELVRGSPRRDLTGPSDQTGRAQPTLRRREIRPFEDARATSCDQQVLGTVVACKDDDRVLGDAELLEHVEQLAEVVVELDEAVGPVA